jgi:predicted Kef-type K+ transport protein
MEIWLRPLLLGGESGARQFALVDVFKRVSKMALLINLSVVPLCGFSLRTLQLGVNTRLENNMFSREAAKTQSTAKSK